MYTFPTKHFSSRALKDIFLFMIAVLLRRSCHLPAPALRDLFFAKPSSRLSTQCRAMTNIFVDADRFSLKARCKRVSPTALTLDKDNPRARIKSLKQLFLQVFLCQFRENHKRLLVSCINKRSNKCRHLSAPRIFLQSILESIRLPSFEVTI